MALALAPQERYLIAPLVVIKAASLPFPKDRLRFLPVFFVIGIFPVDFQAVRKDSARLSELGLALRFLLLLIQPCALFDGMNDIWPLFAETLVVKLLDEIRQRQFPGLLAVVVQLTELFRIHAELARHLNLGMRQPVASARLYPGLQMNGDTL